MIYSPILIDHISLMIKLYVSSLTLSFTMRSIPFILVDRAEHWTLPSHCSSCLAPVRGLMALELFRSLAGILIQGSESNWWGLGCPSHCRGPGFGGLLASYLLGILTVLCLWLLWIGAARDLRPPAVAEPQVTRTLSTGARKRLAGYSHGQGAAY